MCVLQPAFVHSQRIYVPVLVEGDGPLHGEHRLRVVIRSGLKYQGQAVCLYVHLGFRSKCLRKVLKTYEDVLMHVCVFPHLMEQRTVSDGNTQGTEAPAQHHVIRGIVTVAAATTGNQPGHCRPAEHHPAHTHNEEEVILFLYLFYCDISKTLTATHQLSHITSQSLRPPASPSSSCDVAVSILNQAVAVSLPEAHRFLWVVAAQQAAQPR